MVEFTETFDFLKSITPHMGSLEDQALTIEEINPKIVGQERNGILLYTWYSKQANKTTRQKTHISFYDTTRLHSGLLFTHNDSIDIVNASVSQGFILLAFTVREKQPAADRASPGVSAEIFKSYLAEIAPQKRVFSLNIEWHTYQKVEFLYKPLSTSFSSIKKIHMLFTHHKESIGLYHIPVAKLGDDGYVMDSQPKTEQIVRQFLWSQFDPIEQRLYFIQLNAQDEEEEEDAAAMFNAIQFTDIGDHKREFKYILNFQLPLSFKMELMKERVKYFASHLSQTVSNKNLNIKTITTGKGALMICYQHQNEDSVSYTEDGRQSTPRFVEDDTLSLCSTIQGNDKIAYTVCCIHGGYSISCSVSMKSSDVTSSQLLFTIFGDYLMVFLPGVFLHLLDCGNEHKPMHHILLLDDDCPKAPINTLDVDSFFTPVTWDYIPGMQQAVLLFENTSQKTFKVSLNHKSLMKIFSKTRHASTRLAILHSAIVHIKDSAFAKKLIECLCQDPANVECSDLLKEYLIAYSYANMKRQLGSKLLKTLPLSCSEPFRGLVERDRESERSVFLAYKKYRKELIDMLLNLLRKKENEFWSYLKENIELSQDANVKRLPLQTLAFASLNIEKKENQTPRLPSKGLTSRSRQGSISSYSSESSKRLSEEHSPFSEKRDKENAAEEQNYDENLAAIVKERVVSHMLKCFPRENKGRVQKICEEYASCRGKVVKSLWRHLSKVLGYNTEAEVYKEFLVGTENSTDYALFQMLERLHLCLAQLCFPGFRDMQNIFIALGYRCLPSHVFLQYLDAHVFTVKPDFVLRFIKEVHDDDETISTKIELISRLPKCQAKSVVETWNHPIGKRFISQDLVSRFSRSFGEETVTTTGGMDSEGHERNSSEPGGFLPLETFLRSLRFEENSKVFGSHRLTDEELQLVTDSAKREMKFLDQTRR